MRKPERGGRGLVAAVALAMVVVAAPRVGRRDSREALAISTLRALMSAEAAYYSATGSYAMPACLAEPSCAGGQFLEPSLGAARERHGYELVFHPGPRRPVRPETPPSAGLTAYAVVAVPAGENVGRGRAYCGDASGLIYWTTGGVPAVEDARCVDTAHPLR